MMYTIPAENLEKLAKKIKRAQKKTNNIVFNVGESKMVAFNPENPYASPIYIKCYEVEVSGEYKSSGWEFVATIEHTENGNIIRKAVEVEVPERYRNTTPICEHCNKERNRKDTYLVRNLESGEFKQVGKSCLFDYTGGLNAEECAFIATFIEEVKEMSDYDSWGCIDFTCPYMVNSWYKKVAYALIRKNGYSKDYYNGTVATIRKMEHGMQKELVESVSDEEIGAVDAWVETVDRGFDYYNNAYLAWKLDYIEGRHEALIASFVNCYFKELEKEKAKKAELESLTNEHVGNVGDKVSIDVISWRVLYTKEPYAYNGDVTWVYRFVGKDGNVYIWSTTKDIPWVDGTDHYCETFKVEATVKSHNEYNSEKQTVITRGKFLTA